YTPSPGGLPGQSDTFTFQAIDVLGAQSAETIITINYVTLNPSAHQNPTNKYDVNADGFVSPIDALIVINFLNNVGSSTPVSSLSYTPPPYRDVNGDFFISPIDVLQIINRLNRGEGEGEGPSPIASQLATPSITVATERESEFFW
ncbi:MAG: dockerin type I domain-containing protein, partial [Pirellulaceae bacterium]